jgi:hypothetical protein
VHAGVAFRWEHRNYLDAVQVNQLVNGRDGAAVPPSAGYHQYRVDDRLTVDAYLKREVAWGLVARLSFYALVSLSNVDNQVPDPSRPNLYLNPFDFDDKNFHRIVATFDLLRSF